MSTALSGTYPCHDSELSASSAQVRRDTTAASPLQVAFDWTDSHLHRFSLGGHPFDRTSQLFRCPYDVEEGELNDEGGIPDADVRLDERSAPPEDSAGELEVLVGPDARAKATDYRGE
jgi:hypothetical protein